MRFPVTDSPEAKERIRKSKQNKHDFLKPYMMDYWYPRVSDMTIPAIFVEIPSGDFVNVFDGREFAGSDDFILQLENAIGGKKHFIKTNNRSPKDWSYPDAPSASNAKEAIHALAGSMRILDDCVDLMDIAPFYAVVRPWVDIDPKYEFRCFVKNGKMIAVTQYFYDRYFPGLDIEAGGIKEKIEIFHQALAERYPVKDYVFDVYINSGTVILIEINPYGLSDPCLFETYENIETVGGFRTKEKEAA